MVLTTFKIINGSIQKTKENFVLTLYNLFWQLKMIRFFSFFFFSLKVNNQMDLKLRGSIVLLRT